MSKKLAPGRLKDPSRRCRFISPLSRAVNCQKAEFRWDVTVLIAAALEAYKAGQFFYRIYDGLRRIWYFPWWARTELRKFFSAC